MVIVKMMKISVENNNSVHYCIENFIGQHKTDV